VGSEAGRGLIRIASNYGRLFATLCLGMAAVRLELIALGHDAVGLIMLLGSAIGIGAMLQEIVRASMIRELGEAYHSGDDDRFRATYNSALVICAAAAVATLGIFGVLVALLPFFDIPANLLDAARWFTFSMGVQSFFVILLAPTFNMYVVSERMVAFNAWTVAEKAGQPLAAALLVFLFGYAVATDAEPRAEEGLILLGWLGTAIFVAALLGACVRLAFADPRLVPRVSLIQRRAVRSILHIGTWNVATVTANNLHIRVDSILMNLAFGVAGNLIFGLGVQLTSYARMITTGVTTGLDAVAARFSLCKGEDAMRRLTEQSTLLHGLVTFPAAVVIVMLAEPILRVWVQGPRLPDLTDSMPQLVTLVRVLMVGIALRAISDGWARILYGAGHIRRYAPLVLLGGLCNPALVGVLLALLPGEGLTEGIRYLAPALGFSIIITIVHMIALPWIGAPLLGVARSAMFTPLIRPLAASLAAAPVLWFALRSIDRWNLTWLLAALAAYGGVYGLLTLFLVLNAEYRARLWELIQRRIAGEGSREATETADDAVSQP
jgi:O-antigen/teichoic acid export membrane protein